MHQILEVIDIQNEHLLLSSLNTSKTLQREQDVDFGFQRLKTCSFHNWGEKENVFSLSNTFFSLRLRLLQWLYTDWRHAEYAGCKGGSTKIKLRGISITEDILSKLQRGLKDRSKIYELFKNHKWSLTFSKCSGASLRPSTPPSLMGAGAFLEI